MAKQIALNFEETQRESETVPPEVHTPEIGKHRIDVVDVASAHGLSVSENLNVRTVKRYPSNAFDYSNAGPEPLSERTFCLLVWRSGKKA